MIETPTRGAREVSHAWTASPLRAGAVRLSAIVIPLLLGWLAVRLLSPGFWNGESSIAFIAQAMVVAIVVSVSAERATRRFLPLAFLLDQSLVFPDEAPSRFGAALRANSLGRIDKRIDEIRSGHGDHSEQQAAVSALSLVAALSSHDRLTRGHTERVRAYADLIAVELGLSDVARSRLSWGVLLHDIGKLTVPSEILNKRTPLTDEEWEILRNHPLASAEILAPLEGWLGEWGRAAAEHHERWDGNGYPMGLTGRDISLAGRITAVADAYDVITSARSYKEPLSGEAARSELVRCAGEQFDPVVVRAMLQVSTGKQRNFGFWSWLTEVPTFARLLATAGSTSTGVAVAVVASVAGVAAPLLDALPADDPPSAVAFVETTSVDPTDTADLPPAPQDNASERDDRGTNVPSTVSPTTTPPDVAPLTTVTTTSSPATTSPSALTSPTSTATSGHASGDQRPHTTSVVPPATSPPTSSTGPPARPTPPTTTSAPPSTPTTSTPSVVSPLVLYLTNPGNGSSSGSKKRLPLDLGSPTAGEVGNFDRNRNDDPGITIKKQGSGFGGADDTEVQLWEYLVRTDQTIVGDAELELYIAAKDFDTSKQLGVAAVMVICDPMCTTVASTTWTSSATSGWKKATLDFGQLSQNVTAGAILEIRIIVPDSVADDDMMIAFGSVAEPSALHVR